MKGLQSARKFILAQPLIQKAIQYSAENGKHLNNPYHNLKHCALVATVAVFYGQEDFLEEWALEILALAGIFHDFNHSGQPLRIIPDSENIQNAISGFRQFAEENKYSSKLSRQMIEFVCDTIASTEVKLVDNAIQFQPNPSLLARYIRDADVTQLLFVEGQALQFGLSKEMGLCFDSHFARKAIDFVNGVELFTVPALARRVISQEPVQNWLKGFVD